MHGGGRAEKRGKLTWIGQDGVRLGQKLVTADSLVAFSTPGGEKREE